MSSLLESTTTSTIEAPERRGSARSPLFMLVRVEGREQPLWAYDIGLGGLFCRAAEPIWPGTYLDVSFTLPGSDTEHTLGAQVVGFDEEDGQMSLGLRFCRISVQLQRTLYRFLDARRTLWEGDELQLTDAPENSDVEVEPDPPAHNAARPFEGLLLEAYASLRAKELQRLGFVRNLPLDDLPKLSSLTRAA